MSDRTDAGIAALALAASIGGLLMLGIPLDDNYRNPDYAACRHRGGAFQDCIHYARHSQQHQHRPSEILDRAQSVVIQESR